MNNGNQGVDGIINIKIDTSRIRNDFYKIYH